VFKSDTILLFSGIVSIILTWTFVVFPVLRIGINVKKQTISEIASQNKSVLTRVSIGLLLGGVFQLLFAIHLLSKLEVPLYSFSTFIYLSTCLITFLVVIFPEHKSPKIHTYLVRYYFFTVPLYVFLIAIRIIGTNTFISYLCFLLVALYLVLNTVVIQRLQKATIISEVTSFLIISLWIILMTAL
jgi:hypothetical protein